MARKPKLRNSHKTTDFDDKFEAFLKESMSSDDSSLDTSRVAKYLEVQKKKEQPWWMNEVEEDEDDNDLGLTMTGKNFLKSGKDRVGSVTKPQMERSAAADTRMSRDSLDGDSLRERATQKKDNTAGAFVPTLSLDSSQTYSDTLTADKPNDSRRMGFETMIEEKEKDHFFQALEHKSVKTVDYARLNEELDMSHTVAVGKEETTSQYKMAATENVDRGDEDHSQDMQEHKNVQQKSSMLSKVSLLDSLDSTLGTKPAASREAKDDMQAIPEGVGEQDGEEGVANGEMRGETLTDDTDETDVTDVNRGTDTNKGVTLKTATVCNTDTSREIEALHQALRQAGGEATVTTLGSISKDFTFKDSSSKMFHETGGITDGTHSTAAFAMKPVALPRGGRQDRTVDDVIMEVQQAKRLPELGLVSDMATIAMTTNSVLGKIEEENGVATPKRGFGIHSQYNGDVSQGMSPICNGKDSLDMSLLEKYDESEDFGFDTSTPYRKAVSRSGQAPAPAKRTGCSMSHTPDKKAQRYAHIKSSGYGVVSPAKSHQARVTWLVSEAAKQKPSGRMSEKSRSRSGHSPTRRSTSMGRMGSSQEGNSMVDSQLLQSFSQMLQEYLSSGGTNEDNVTGCIKRLSVERVKVLMDEITKWQHQYHEQQKTTLELRADMEAMEQDFDSCSDSMKTQYEQEISQLKQQNYVLNAKVDQLQKQLSHRTLVKDGDTETGETSSRFAGLEKELEEQEKLITGFQMENERLYSELKTLRGASKETEAHMFSDNQKLRVDIAMLREALQRKEEQLRNKGVITGSEVQGKIAAGLMAAEGTAVLGANRIAQLEVELKQAKLRQESQRSEQQTAREEKRRLELQVDELLRRVRDYEEKMSHFATSFDAKEVETSYKKEIERLNRKIQWYVENQQLLDRDVNVLKEKDNEMRRLRVKLENLQSEKGRKEAEVKAQTKQRITEARRIQDLERQVKEMESIVRKRHPNSLPVLMWAAAAAESEGEVKKPPSIKFLEKQMMKLEDELEVKDGEAERSIRVLEQKYNLMKLQYEDRIRELESLLTKYQHPEEGERPHTHSSALQRELDGVRERHKKKVGDLEHEMDRLKKEVVALKHRETANARAETKSSKEADVELQLKVKLLQQDLSNQEREKQLLQRSVQRLMKDKEQLLTECKNCVRPATGKDRMKSKLSKGGKKKGLGSREVQSEPEPLPPYMDVVARDKVYLPDAFAGQHVSEILKENEEVKFKVDRLQLELEHQRVYHQKLLAENEAHERRIREETDERVNGLKAAHQMELNRLLTEHVMNNSASRVTELRSKLDAQEIVVRHLREQIASAEVDREKLSVLRVRELALETQVSKLQDDLHEAKKCHSPEMRHLDALRTKINEMEARHAQRERELQQLLTQSNMNADADIRHEVDKWRHIVEAKNREIETFRMELDAILDVLRELQRQGVVLPCRTLPNR